MPEPDKVEILKSDYVYLLKRDHELALLEAGGVDNWEGYSFCFANEKDEDEEE